MSTAAAQAHARHSEQRDALATSSQRLIAESSSLSGNQLASQASAPQPQQAVQSFFSASSQTVSSSQFQSQS